MAEPVRHRQTKEAETDMFYLKPPRHISTLPKADWPAAGSNVRFRGQSGHDFSSWECRLLTPSKPEAPGRQCLHPGKADIDLDRAEVRKLTRGGHWQVSQ
jgi:hypothetical protein